MKNIFNLLDFIYKNNFYLIFKLQGLVRKNEERKSVPYPEKSEMYRSQCLKILRNSLSKEDNSYLILDLIV